MSTLRAFLRHSLVKQIMGAAVGALAALLMYEAYTFTSSHITAFMTPQASASLSASAVADGERMDQVILRARALIGQEGK